MSEDVSSRLWSEMAVPVHPEPMVEGGRVLDEDGEEPPLLLAITENETLFSRFREVDI